MRRFPPITLIQFALQRVKSTVSWAKWLDSLGIAQAVKRAQCAYYQEWLNEFFPLGGCVELGRIDCERLRDAWLVIGHPIDKISALLAIGSREDRWSMPDAAMLSPLLNTTPAGNLCHPELGETPPARLFHAEHNYGSTYSLCWKTDDDKAARTRLRELRIFPASVERRTPAEWLEAKRLGTDVYSCLVTRTAHRKLCDADLVAVRTLLD